jgi:putative ABC transport system substrate-binding protein
MAIGIGRRQFISALGGASLAWPVAAQAQQASQLPTIGYLHGNTAQATRHQITAFEEGLSQTGYIDRQNVAIEYRWADGQYDRLPTLAADLVRRQVAVISTGTPVAALAAKRATTSIPIVFSVGSDPVKDGLVASLNRPGGNITGATFFGNLLTAKRFELLHEIVPNAKVFFVLVNPKNANAQMQTSEAQQASTAMSVSLVFSNAATEDEIEKSFDNLLPQQVDAVLVLSDAFLNGQASQISELALRHKLPTCFAFREPVVAGGLMGYGASIDDAERKAGNYVGRILKGEKPADLPVQQPTKFEFVINLKTAKALGLTIPPSLLANADDVIE